MPNPLFDGFYRADSASYQAELINDLEGDGVFWAITADQDAAVKRLIESIGPEEWQIGIWDANFY